MILASLTACRSTSGDASTPARPEASRLDDARQDLSQIPPPSKNRYMQVSSLNEWQNPSLTVQEKMISLHVLMPDANPSDLGKGTMLRPEGARRQLLNIDPSNLAAALTASKRRITHLQRLSRNCAALSNMPWIPCKPSASSPTNGTIIALSVCAEFG